ncbi:serine hydrolase [Candidatus Microgenomates bacterium]|nr:MAG: serine hydrolase [Candidatus Microgenomates bacterium]
MIIRKKQLTAKMALAIGVLILLFLLIRTFVNSDDGNGFISPLPDEIIKVITSNGKSKIDPAANQAQLLEQIKKSFETEKGSYSIYIYDLKSDSGFGLNESAIFTAASVNKIYILAALYHQADQGKLDLDEDITIQSKDIQDYGTGVIRYQGAGTVYSLKTLAQLMIEKSDNTAAFVLTNIIGANTIQQLVNDWGFIQTDIDNNKSSNKDVAGMFLKIYRGEVTDQAHTQEMIGFMDDSDFENRLPKDLPKNINVYHKIGSEVGVIHDAGIVDLPEHPYYIGVLTNDISDIEGTENKISEISKMVFDYFNK